MFPDNIRGRSSAVATSKMERFVIIVNGFQSLTIITKCFILDVAAALYPPLNIAYIKHKDSCFSKYSLEIHATSKTCVEMNALKCVENNPFSMFNSQR